MLVRLLTLGLVAFAAGIDDLPLAALETMGINPSEYITISSQVERADLHLYNGPRYYIPDGECLGHLHTKYLCGAEKAKGIEVRVSDPHDFARVRVHQERGVVHIQRRGRAYNATTRQCPDAAQVDVRLSCVHWKFSNSRNRLRLPGSSESSDYSDSTDSRETVYSVPGSSESSGSS